MGDNRDFYTPSPAEIRAECAKLQADWDDRERRKRAGVVFEPVEVIEVETPATSR